MTLSTTLDACSFCGASLPDTASECSTCGKTRARSTPLSEWNAFTPGRHFALLWVLTWGLYIVVWYYRAWKFLRIEMREDVRPILRALLMFVPIVGQVMMFRMFKDICWLANRSDGPAFSSVMTVWGGFAAGRIAERINEWLGMPFYFIAGLGIWTIQRRINEHYARAGITHARMPVYGWVICGVFLLAWLRLLLELVDLIAAE
jgi:hypothetical protein